MKERRAIVWTEPAARSLGKLPENIRRMLIEKADRLLECPDPKKLYKPLSGPLQGYYSIRCSRYRAVFTVAEEGKGGKEIVITIFFVIAGTRREGDKKDVYRLAQKLVDLGVIEITPKRPPAKSP